MSDVCPNSPDPDCSGKFRDKRIFGANVTNVITDTPEESIQTRLVKLLQFLDAQHPEQGWGTYLKNGEPNWDRMVVSGLSQGAGMAAYIAKVKRVERVVLFSSPWDTTVASTGITKTARPAPWLYKSSATPLEHWFAEYNTRENTVNLIMPAYQALQIPADQIHLFSLDIPANINFNSTNPYHLSTVKLPGYIPQWRQMFGHACYDTSSATIHAHACTN